MLKLFYLVIYIACLVFLYQSAFNLFSLNMKKETLKTILNTISMIISAIAAAIASSSCISKLI